MPLDFIIGGPAMAGQGWRMLMECPAAGRSISLPSSNTGMSKRPPAPGAMPACAASSAPVGSSGVEEALARIGGHTHDGRRAQHDRRRGGPGRKALGRLRHRQIPRHRARAPGRQRRHGRDRRQGHLPRTVNFWAAPTSRFIGITVEGANILTRSLIIFGQGAIRCHPYVLAEMQAAQSSDRQQGLHDFDRAFWGHVGFVEEQAARAGHRADRRRLVGVNTDVAPEMKRYYQQLSRYSAAFALLADTSMLVLGGSLKRRERLSARLGDILSQMYLISATLKRYQDEGRQAADAAGALVDPGRAVPPAGSLRRRAGKLPEPLLSPGACAASSSPGAIRNRCPRTNWASRSPTADQPGPPRPPDRRLPPARHRRRAGGRHRAGAGRHAGGRTHRGQDPRAGKARRAGRQSAGQRARHRRRRLRPAA